MSALKLILNIILANVICISLVLPCLIFFAYGLDSFMVGPTVFLMAGVLFGKVVFDPFFKLSTWLADKVIKV